MRVMLDTNVLISALIFKSNIMNRIIDLIAKKYSLVLCSHIIDELHDVISEKFIDRKEDLERFILELPFELVYTPHPLPINNYFTIKGKSDEKILFSAIISDVDIFVTGDTDFNEVVLKKPLIISPAKFIQEF